MKSICCLCPHRSRLQTWSWDEGGHTLWKIAALLFWALKHNKYPTAYSSRLWRLSKSNSNFSGFFFSGPACVFFLFFFSGLAYIRLTLHMNVGTWKTWPGPSVTLQMALLVKVGHVGFLLSTRDGTMEITGVWSVAWNTAPGLQDTGRGPDLWMPLFLVSTSRDYKMQSHTERWWLGSWVLVSIRLSVILGQFFSTLKCCSPFGFVSFSN